MLRSIFEEEISGENDGNFNELSDISSHYSHDNWSGIPSMRLTDKNDEDLEQVPVYSVRRASRRNAAKTFELQTGPPYIYRATSQTDTRFIPNRKGQNFDASRYNLLNKAKPTAREIGSSEYLDIINQIKTVNESWRKRLMVKAIERSNIFKGVDNQRVLNVRSISPLNEPYTAKDFNQLEDKARYELDNAWKVKPRCKPLLGEYRHKLELPSRGFPPRGSVDWSSKNCIVAPINNRLHFFSFLQLEGMYKKNHTSISIESSFPGSRQIRCMKWNNAGTSVALFSRSLTLCIFHIESMQILWSEECLCPNGCDIKCLSWSGDDKLLITGCTEGRVCFFRTDGPDENRLIERIPAHTAPVLMLALSCNDRYLATTGMDKRVRVYLFPDVILWLEIGYYDATQSLAWHPWDANILCIGGGIGDGSLSLWDITGQQSFGYRRVNFFGYVKNMIWNKVSGELVPQWNYYENDNRFVTVPVLASWDRVVDVAEWPEHLGTGVANIIWNPDHTQLGIQLTNYLLVWDFFGYEAQSWKGKKQRNGEKKGSPRRHKSVMNQFCIR